MPLKIVLLNPQIGLDHNPITKALLPPSRYLLLSFNIFSPLSLSCFLLFISLCSPCVDGPRFRDSVDAVLPI